MKLQAQQQNLLNQVQKDTTTTKTVNKYSTKNQHVIQKKIQVQVEVIGKVKAWDFFTTNLKIITVSGLQRSRKTDPKMLD